MQKRLPTLAYVLVRIEGRRGKRIERNRQGKSVVFRSSAFTEAAFFLFLYTHSGSLAPLYKKPILFCSNTGSLWIETFKYIQGLVTSTRHSVYTQLWHHISSAIVSEGINSLFVFFWFRSCLFSSLFFSYLATGTLDG